MLGSQRGEEERVAVEEFIGVGVVVCVDGDYFGNVLVWEWRADDRFPVLVGAGRVGEEADYVVGHFV